MNLLDKLLVACRQIQHTPNRLIRLIRHSDVGNLAYHFTEVKASLSDVAHSKEAQEFIKKLDEMSEPSTKKWTDGNVQRWLSTILKVDLKANCKILEIGSYEGRSTNFWLMVFPKASIICVDTWEGGDEHKDISSDAHADMNTVFNRFVKNTKWTSDRIYICRSPSYLFFSSPENSKDFDLIYIDGSHHGADVIQDAISGFNSLKTGGIMIFDDFLWRYYENPNQNPWAALNFFIRLFERDMKVLRFGEQVHIQKI